MNTMQALSAAEIKELDVFLLSDDRPENSMDISTLNGFFAALALNPELITPNEYFPFIWDMVNGKDAPAFSSMEQAAHIFQLVTHYYSSVAESIVGGEFEPLFVPLVREDGSSFSDAEGWCGGFMYGVMLSPDPWAAIFEKHPEFLAPMVSLGTEDGWEELQKSADARQAAQDASQSIAAAVVSLRDCFGRKDG